MEDNARLETWQAKWEEGKAPWHNQDVNQNLIQYGLPLLEGGPKRCFVPLCGKTLDLKFLYDKGHTVVGVEGVEIAVQNFFELNNISYTVKEAPIKCYKTSDERLLIYVSDIFKIDHSILGTFDFIWDRGSLGAVYLKDRSKYSQLIKNIAKTKCQYLVESVFYDGIEVLTGSPRCVTEDHFEDLFGDAFTITHINFSEVGAQFFKQWGVDKAWRKCTVLTKK